MQAVADQGEADRTVESEDKKNRQHRIWKTGAQAGGACHHAGRTGGVGGVCRAGGDGCLCPSPARDYSFQMLALKGAEEGLFCMSASSVRTILHEESLVADRTGRKRRGVRVKPNRPEELTGPNQCWCWDISYLRTEVLRVFWYLYVMLDEWSRKVVAWRVSRSLAGEEALALALIDQAIITENLLEVSEGRLPVVVNDRGTQMKAKEVKQMFRDLGLTQIFTRPRTPNDNPYAEALFGTVKTSPTYPGWFPSNDKTVVTGYFNRYFTWYDHEHYHSRIGYVTPFQKHTGQAEAIIMQRKKQLTAQREQRKEYWLL